ncbi:hypothetical protein LUZ60_010711 [Juncus effusus]|nr:hypothetical protein LUZ60_010711 [Juncus effusus]
MAAPSINPLINGEARSHESEPELSDGFVAVDISALSALSDEPANKKMMRTMSRKGGDTNCTGGHVAGDKQDVHVHVAVANGDHTGLVSPNPGGKFRRMNSRRLPAPWLNPRRVLFVFATLSSMGTLILLYFTLSMGKMTSEDSNAR